MTKLYVPGPGRTIPGGWPEAGRAIDDTSRLHRNYVRDGDLVEAPEPLTPDTEAPAKPRAKKETNHGE
jgi:hypothetical protein